MVLWMESQQQHYLWIKRELQLIEMEKELSKKS